MDKKKILKSELNYDYDQKADVLYISFGKPREAVCVEREGLLFRVDPYRDAIVGITVIGVKDRLYPISRHNVEEFTRKQLEKYFPLATQ